jgi:hypothetical protein
MLKRNILIQYVNKIKCTWSLWCYAEFYQFFTDDVLITVVRYNIAN